MTTALLCPKCALTWHRRPLTKRQAEIYAYLEDHIHGHGYAPSFEDIARRFRFASLATVHEHLDTLARKGYVTRRFNEARGLTLVGEPQP